MLFRSITLFTIPVHVLGLQGVQQPLRVSPGPFYPGDVAGHWVFRNTTQAQSQQDALTRPVNYITQASFCSPQKHDHSRLGLYPSRSDHLHSAMILCASACVGRWMCQAVSLCLCTRVSPETPNADTCLSSFLVLIFHGPVILFHMNACNCLKAQC